MKKSNPYLIPFIALTSLFFIWGFLTVMVDAFIPRLKEVFELGLAQAGLVQFAWFIAYGCISIPGGILVSKMGYKKGIVGGLTIVAIGCLLFMPAAAFRSFPFFLAALFTLAGGITVLQVAANPFVAVLGPEESASSRLNLAQAFNSVGATFAPVIAAAFLLSDSIKGSDQIAALSAEAKEAYYASEAAAVQQPFLVIAICVFVIAGIFAVIKLPKILESEETTGTYAEALQFKHLRWGVLGIFVYVGAEVALGSYLVNYFMDFQMDQAILASEGMSSVAGFMAELFSGKLLANMDGKAIVGVFVTFYWGGAMIGRFVGSYVMQKVDASKVLGFFALGPVILLLITMGTTGYFAFWAVLLVGFFNSIMFPTIFTLSLEGLGDYKPRASGLLCTAIVGGAFIPPLFGYVADTFGFTLAFIVPILCYTYISFLGWSHRSRVTIGQ